MNKREKIVQEQFINDEEAVIRRLKKVYGQALEDINKNAKDLQTEIEGLNFLYDSIEDEEEKKRLKSMQQSKIYQKQYQDAMKKQISGILDTMQVEEFKTVSGYLNKCYEEGFLGTMYNLQGQGIPLVFPMDQEAIVRAVQLDSKISKGLYQRLGEDVGELKKKITATISRGISTGMRYEQVAQQLAGYTNIGFNNAVRIARTEGHRIQVQSTMDACYKAKDKGADVVKQWDSTLDGKTRDSHAQVDGEVRELDEKFSNGLRFPSDPHGKAAEIINCRCALLQRARWALGDEFTKMDNFTGDLKTFENDAAYKDFKKDYFSKENKAYMKYVDQMEKKYGRDEMLARMTNQEFNHFKQLEKARPVFQGMYQGQNVIKIDKTDFDEFKKEYLKAAEGLGKDGHVIAQGTDMSGKIDYENSEFEYDIETAMHAQGFDGLPRVVEQAEFDEAVKQSSFIAQRNYSAPSQEVLDAYRDELYKGKWYVDCSDGGSQYGQGMYSAADYKGVLSDGIKEEMSHYAGIGKNKFGFEAFKKELDNVKLSDFNVAYKMTEEEFEVMKKYMASSDFMPNIYKLSPKEKDIFASIKPKARESARLELARFKNEVIEKTPHYSYTETFTLDKTAKIFELPKNKEADEFIWLQYRNNYLLTHSEGKQHELVKEFISVSEERYKAMDIGKYDEIDAFDRKIDKLQSEISDELFKEAKEATLYYPKGFEKYGKTKDAGTLAAEMGYDAINAVGHGKSGSYTVILNRTKCIFLKGGSNN